MNTLDDMYISYVPNELKHWLNEKSPVSPDWMRVYQVWIDNNKDLELTKDFFRELYMTDAKTVYGEDYPAQNMDQQARGCVDG